MRSFKNCEIAIPKSQSLFFDMDATVIKEESLTLLAEYCNLTAEVAAITKRAMAGEIDFAESVSARLQLLKGLRVSDLKKCAANIHYNPGIKFFLDRCHVENIPTFLVSGGFSDFADKVVAELGFKKVICNKFEIIEEKLTGNYIPPIIDAVAKENFLYDTCSEYKLDPKTVVAVGDGANDINMANAAGFSVGFLPKEPLRKIVNFVNNSGDHTAMLPLFFNMLSK